MKSVLFVASEGLPFIKSGGLADVIGALPKSLVKRGHDVRVVLPLYLKMAINNRKDFNKVCTFDVHAGNINTICTVYSQNVDGVLYYFLEHANYFEREGMYGYPDDGERFSFFQIATLEMLKEIDYFPDIIHSHDWHTGMISALCKIRYANDSRYRNIKHVFTIHNLAYQGNFPASVLSDCLGLSMSHYYDGSMKFHDGISFMKTAILFSDKISTVSNTYAHEILSSEYGEQLNEVLNYRKNDLWGIVNGIDTNLWNPKTDSYITCQYDLKSIKNKAKNKKALQEKLGLRVSDDTLLVAMVSRLTWQKGVYLIVEKLAEILALDLQLVILGTGESLVENKFKQGEYQYKRKMVYYCGYNEALAHEVYAGADVLLMPSLFEPCGISQLIAMRYGTLPLVRETGGLKDTVQPFNRYTNEGNGFSFYPFNSSDLWFTLKCVCDTYYTNQDGFKALIKNAMNTDVSFEKSCDLYEKLYDELS